MVVFPAILKLLGSTAATFGETRVAHLVVMHQQHATGGADSFGNGSIGCLGDALITLAVVVSAYIKDGMVFAVIPTDVFLPRLGEREETFVLSAHGLPFFYLGEKPAARNDGMRFQQFQRRVGTHLG